MTSSTCNRAENMGCRCVPWCTSASCARGMSRRRRSSMSLKHRINSCGHAIRSSCAAAMHTPTSLFSKQSISCWMRPSTQWKMQSCAHAQSYLTCSCLEDMCMYIYKYLYPHTGTYVRIFIQRNKRVLVLGVKDSMAM
jgi:hypothetical protein